MCTYIYIEILLDKHTHIDIDNDIHIQINISIHIATQSNSSHTQTHTHTHTHTHPHPPTHTHTHTHTRKALRFALSHIFITFLAAFMGFDIQNLGVSGDPFSNATANEGDVGVSSSGSSLIHIRNQQRNGRKSVTTVQGLDKGFDLKKMVRALKKEYSCNGTVIEDPDHGPIVQLQGDKRQDVKSFLEREGICSSDQIRVHGA
eukprot:GHVQ01008520.1.p1 GENE.GHVQ01008520.1~~GHVQ01008520.1.p1  ORF type:complete len:203 (+),score=38.25 GHVQ01008520.1:216-824(+)